ncbi:MAG TPA: SDR family oxidoreductase [candidate division Zixibacteria bacterium]|nr:SDR family oxidoreductase [candidate division Zixibacteria bacterium]
MEKLFEGKVALVTGGTKGIGLATARNLARGGATVIVNYFKSRDAANAACEELKALGSAETYAVRCNLAKHEKIPELFVEIKDKFGKLDFFISNAAMGLYSDMLKVDRRNWEVALDTNAYALLVGTQCATPMMPEGGRIVALSSLGSIRYIPGYASIGVGKAAIENLIRYIAVELAEKKITANVVCGGFIDTDALKGFPTYDTLKTEVLARSPWGRMGTPEDLADVVEFLCTEKSRWITGQSLIVDGGYSLM